MSVDQPIKLALLWHMHQPDYRDPHSSVAAAPWVRLRATKDYLDMLMLATEHENIKVTFNLVPSLIEQFNHYANGGSDCHLEVTRLNASQITTSQKREVLAHSFKCNLETMIKPYQPYYHLYLKWESKRKELHVEEFTEQEIRDLQVWSNLTWIDPIFRSQEPVNSLFRKGFNFDEQDKVNLIAWQRNHVRKVIPAYQNMFKMGKIDISFSPYFHPILPLLCDSRSSMEVLPNITLPRQLFRHPEDARHQIKMSMNLYEDLFQVPMQGIWPSEGSISEESLKICSECGIKWTASDEQVLFRSLQKSGMSTMVNHPYCVYEYAGGMKLLFRDHVLSDKIAFVYASWDPEKAARDFITNIKNARRKISNHEEPVIVPVILDGENSWEYYKGDGIEFLRELYKGLSKETDISTVTMSGAALSSKPRPLRSVSAGSWIDNSFRIWIGHEEDNSAWDYLKSARDYLTDFEKSRPDFNQKVIAEAWREIYIAEASDWFWWYGEEHRGPDNYLFDAMFRSHLARVYELLQAEIPIKLRLPIISRKYRPAIVMPDALLTPTIDGKISHFYEWFGAGQFPCLPTDITVHRVFRLASLILFSFDHNAFYLRVDFVDPDMLKSLKNPAMILRILTPAETTIVILAPQIPFAKNEKGKYICVWDEVFEIGITRSFLWTDGYGKLAFGVELWDGEQLIEKWPEEGNIECDIPEKNKELFWHQ